MTREAAAIQGDVLYACNLSEIAINIMVATGVCSAQRVIEHLDQRLLPLEQEQSLVPYNHEAVAHARARMEYMIESLRAGIVA